MDRYKNELIDNLSEIDNLKTLWKTEPFFHNNNEFDKIRNLSSFIDMIENRINEVI